MCTHLPVLLCCRNTPFFIFLYTPIFLFNSAASSSSVFPSSSFILQGILIPSSSSSSVFSSSSSPLMQGLFLPSSSSSTFQHSYSTLLQGILFPSSSSSSTFTSSSSAMLQGYFLLPLPLYSHLHLLPSHKEFVLFYFLYLQIFLFCSSLGILDYSSSNVFLIFLFCNAAGILSLPLSSLISVFPSSSSVLPQGVLSNFLFLFLCLSIFLFCYAIGNSPFFLFLYITFHLPLLLFSRAYTSSLDLPLFSFCFALLQGKLSSYSSSTFTSSSFVLLQGILIQVLSSTSGNTNSLALPLFSHIPLFQRKLVL